MKAATGLLLLAPAVMAFQVPLSSSHHNFVRPVRMAVTMSQDKPDTPQTPLPFQPGKQKLPPPCLLFWVFVTGIHY